MKIEVGPGVAQAEVQLQIIGDLERAVGEQGDLAVVGLGVVDVVVAIGQQVHAPGGDHVLAPQILGQVPKLRVADLLGAALAVVGVEHARGPGQAGAGIIGLQADFLSEVLLGVGDHVRRRIGAEARQIQAVGVQ